MSKEVMYFKDEDSNTCHPLEAHLDTAREEGLSEVCLLRATPDPHSDFVWCMYSGEVSNRCDCRKSECSQYTANRSGRGVCVYRGTLYRHGSEETFKVSDDE